VTDVDDTPPAIAHTDPSSPGDLTPVVLDCEYGLLGAVLRSDSVEQVADVLAMVTEHDFADPKVGYAVALARAVVADGFLPAPSVLLARLSTEHGAHRYQLMAMLLVDAWWAGPPPLAAWPLVLAVLEAAYRRTARRWAQRVLQAIDGPLDVLAEVVRDTTEMRTARRRLTAAQRGSTPNRSTTIAPHPAPDRGELHSATEESSAA
jgi:hypothetical protein